MKIKNSVEKNNILGARLSLFKDIKIEAIPIEASVPAMPTPYHHILKPFQISSIPVAIKNSVNRQTITPKIKIIIAPGLSREFLKYIV